jgi:cell division protein FtsB
MTLVVPVLPMIPLFLGFPGGIELLVILFIAIIVFGLPVVLVAGGFYLYRNTQSERPASEEVESLREEVSQLREEIEALDDKQ